MAIANAGSTPSLSPATPSSGLLSSPGVLRLLLVAGCAASVALAAWVGEPGPSLRADPELAVLLRGMATIKAVIVLAALALLCWRFRRPVSPRSAVAYLVGAWMAAGAAMLVWQLSFIPLAALTFHVGEFTLLFAAWRDRRG